MSLAFDPKQFPDVFPEGAASVAAPDKPTPDGSSPPADVSAAPPPKRGRGRPKGSKTRKRAPRGSSTESETSSSASGGEPGAEMLERPAVETTDAPESKSRRYALGRRQIAELAPAWRNLTDLVAPLASAAVRARVGVDLDTKIVKGAETVAKNGDIELDVRSMAGTEALSIACSELLAYYVPIGGADHPAAPAAMTLFGLVSVVALASMRGDGRSAPHAPDEGAADARVSEAG